MPPTGSKLRVLLVGCGNMGAAHARAYDAHPQFEVCGCVSRGATSREALARQVGDPPCFGDVVSALEATGPDVVCISTYPDTHVSLSELALRAGAHVFVEKPLAPTLKEAQSLIDLARDLKRTLLVGYILRVHPGWQRFVAEAGALGTPLIMRFSLNQKSDGEHWKTHLHLLKSANPVVDSGVHYVDIMTQMTGARPVSVSAIGARVSSEVSKDQVNYGQLQVRFDDDSVGWFEAGWGPMMSTSGHNLRDVIGPRGARQLVLTPHEDLTWDALCLRQQDLLLKAIRGDVDLSGHHQACIDSLAIVLAAERAMRSGETIRL